MWHSVTSEGRLFQCVREGWLFDLPFLYTVLFFSEDEFCLSPAMQAIIGLGLTKDREITVSFSVAAL